MKLSTQNTLLLWFSAFSAIIGLCFLIGITFFLIETKFESILFSQLLLEENNMYAYLPLVFFSLYVPIVGFTIYKTFEKTKSPEMLYFITMLIGFFAQSILICIPIFSLHTGYTLFLTTISRIAFFGQVQVILSILFQGVLVAQDETRDSDRFAGIISVISLSFSAIIPLDVTTIAEELLPNYGFESVFSTIRIVFIIVAFGSMYLSNTSKKNRDYKQASIAFLCLCIGYVIVLRSFSLLALFIGIMLFTIGTIRFLKRLHRYYMWK